MSPSHDVSDNAPGPLAGPGASSFTAPPAAPTTAPAPAAAPAPASAPGGRLDALDRFRGAALVAMLLHHLCQWMTGDARAVLPGWPDFALTDVAAPAFFMAAGASCSLLVASRRRRGLSPVRIAGIVLRRYGLLVPIGMGMHRVLWGPPYSFGVLEALGVTVAVGALVAALLPGGLLTFGAVAALVAGVLVERGVTGQVDWMAVEFWAGAFPVVTYLGFVLVGMVAVRSGRFVDRRWMAGAALLGIGAVLVMLADGLVPARYPGDIGLVLPGLAGSAIAYALCQARWPGSLGGLDRVLRRAAAHTFGIFVSHYGIYWLLDRTGAMGTASGIVAVPVAVVVTVALCLVAPRVPQPPWTPRTGWRPRSHPAPPAAPTAERQVSRPPG
jgi:Heparan-alpha-glucosaminide N-acetyltransferase, catalytic